MRTYERNGIASVHYRGYRLERLPFRRGWRVTGKGCARHVATVTAGQWFIDIRERAKRHASN